MHIQITPNTPGAALLLAVQKQYEAQIATAKATIQVYATSPVAIGEHPQHCEEIDKLLGQIADATDKLESLAKHFEYQ
jgi:hypothetical protein